jgi:hypothetical protein
MSVISCVFLDVMSKLDKDDPVTFLLSKSSLAAIVRYNKTTTPPPPQGTVYIHNFILEHRTPHINIRAG